MTELLAWVFRCLPNAAVVVGNTVHPSVYNDLDKSIIFSGHGEPGALTRKVLEHRAIYGFNDTGLYILPVLAPGSDGVVASLTVLTQMSREQVKSTDLYRRHQTFPQRTAEVTFPLNRMLGFFTSITKVVSGEAMKKALPGLVPERFLDLNIKAFDKGYEYGEECLKEKKGKK